MLMLQYDNYEIVTHLIFLILPEAPHLCENDLTILYKYTILEVCHRGRNNHFNPINPFFPY